MMSCGTICRRCKMDYGVQMGDADADEMRIDIQSDEHILWANNIEADRMYWSWQRTLMAMLRPTYPGQLHQIQRNLQNLIAIIDPGTLDGLRQGFASTSACSLGFNVLNVPADGQDCIVCVWACEVRASARFDTVPDFW